ncbi:MAG: toll/interleukin-1 receptor domain-containing protein [Ignavibacteriae bacterium]|nr:toll/interleukin-1 receptor domain-containing protein [Ignavibacteriota bacterium]
MNKRKHRLKIFLSYSSNDKSEAGFLKQILQQRFDVELFSSEMLSAGEDWRTRLKNELNICDFFIVLLSPNSLSSEWLLQELGAAWVLDKHIIPIITKKEIINRLPFDLNEYKMITFNEIKGPQSFDRYFQPNKSLIAA